MTGADKKERELLAYSKYMITCKRRWKIQIKR